MALPGTPVKILVRPEKLKVLKSAPDANQNAVEGTLKEVLYQGPVTQLFVPPREGNGPMLIVSQPNTAVTARRSFQLGDKVYVAWLPEDCLLMGREAALAGQRDDRASRRVTGHDGYPELFRHARRSLALAEKVRPVVKHPPLWSCRRWAGSCGSC